MTEPSLKDLLEPDTTVDALKELVGEDKKFKSVDDLARGKLEADNFINKLTTELSELREELTTKTKELENKMSLENLLTATGGNPPNGQPGGDEVKNTPDINSIVETAIAEAEKRRTAAANEATVFSKLKEEWGEEASQKLKEAANSLGFDTDYLTDVARRSPQALFRLLGLDGAKPQPSGNVTRGSVTNIPTGGNVRNAKYYENLKNTDRNSYFSQKVQLQMYNDAMSLGEKFYQ